MRKRVYGPIRSYQAASKIRRRPKSRAVVSRRAKSFGAPARALSFNKISPAVPLRAQLWTKFIYAETGLSLDPGVAGTTGVRVFSLNSLFDPDVTGAGHQPAGYDQMMAIYEDYLVYGARYKVSCYGTDSSNEYIAGVTATDNLGTASDPRVYIENGMTQWGLMCAKAAGAGERILQFSGYVDLAKLHGQDFKTYIDESQYKATVSQSPTDQGYLHLWVAPANASSDLSTTVWCVEIEYNCVLSGGKLNPLS